MENIADFLGKIEILSMLESDEILQIMDLFKALEIEEGTTLFEEGDEGNDMYIITSGEMGVHTKQSDGTKRELASFEAGNFFGEMSIFENAPRSATCYSKKKSSVLSLNKNDFYKIIKDFPDIAIKIMYRMLNITTNRLRNTGEFLSDMVQWGEAASKRAITDELTGVYNRRFLEDAIVSQFETAIITGKSFVVVMVDLDFFRTINDACGHATGDRIILEVVDVYNDFLREKDIIARYGGDEFTVLMPETELDEAHYIVENVRTRVGKLNVLKNTKCDIKKITLSQGLASYPQNADDLKKLREKADEALYKAKEEGRDKSVCAD